VITQKSSEISSIRSKLPYRSGSEITDRINTLNAQVESGKLKLIDEKKALNEISVLRRSTRQVTQMAALEESIAEEKSKVEDLRKVLDDPATKATSARWDELRSELDKLREEGKKAYEERGGLFDRRNELQSKMVSRVTCIDMRDLRRCRTELVDLLATLYTGRTVRP
jgi:uncharacterized coiled-coil DUF342 family protein